MNSIFLIGYRGSGKTTVAQLLADKLGWQWCDADAVLEDRFGSIRQIFAAEGEAGFREKEAALLEELCQLQEYVIATGGGVVLRPQNRIKLLLGKVIWLRAEPVVLWQRLRDDPVTLERRPNLAEGGLEEIDKLVRQRTPLYEKCADIEVNTDDKTPVEVAESIYEALYPSR